MNDTRRRQSGKDNDGEMIFSFQKGPLEYQISFSHLFSSSLTSFPLSLSSLSSLSFLCYPFENFLPSDQAQTQTWFNLAWSPTCSCSHQSHWFQHNSGPCRQRPRYPSPSNIVCRSYRPRHPFRTVLTFAIDLRYKCSSNPHFLGTSNQFEYYGMAT